MIIICIKPINDLTKKKLSSSEIGKLCATAVELIASDITMEDEIKILEIDDERDFQCVQYKLSNFKLLPNNLGLVVVDKELPSCLTIWRDFK